MPQTVALSRPDDFADAVSASPFAGTNQAPLIVVENTEELGSNVREYLRQNNLTIADIVAMGGRQAVSDGVVEDARRSATLSASRKPAS